jgi:molybdopterin synthase catalytic subunit
MIRLTHEEIEAAAVLAEVESPLAGAVVLFLGTVRAVTGERRTESLEYECYLQMARLKMEELERSARLRWPITECCLVHRLGHLPIGATSVAVAVSSPHRQDAFEAAKWLIDTLKVSVPIWKKENWGDGTSEWIHPGITQSHDERPDE